MQTAVTVVAPPSALDNIYSRRSVRSYLPVPIDWATVHALLAAAIQAPTAMHEEPWSFVIVQEPTTLEQLSNLAKSLPVGSGHAPHRDTDDRPVVLSVHMAEDIFHGAGTLIVICARPMSPFVTADCWLAAENLMLAASAMGLGTCVIGSAVEALNQPDVKAQLGIPEDTAAVAPIVIGVPKADAPKGQRKPPVILAWK